MKRTVIATIVGLALATSITAESARAEDVPSLQPIETYGPTEADAREAAKRLARLLCGRNERLTRAVRVLPGKCRYEQGSGQWFCYSQKFDCAEQH